MTNASLTAVNVEEINKIFENIKETLRETINSMYEMEIEGEKTMVTHTIWKNDEPVEVWYRTDKENKGWQFYGY